MCVAENTGIDHNSSVRVRRREHNSTKELTTCFSAVSVIGTITLREKEYVHCLADKNSELFEPCNEKLLEGVNKVTHC